LSLDWPTARYAPPGWNVVAHAYEHLDMARVHRAARERPDDFRAFVRVLARLTPNE
jgi:hypothetical protein